MLRREQYPHGVRAINLPKGACPIQCPHSTPTTAPSPSRRTAPHRLDGRLRSPRSTQVLSTRSLGLLNFASEVGLSQHTV